MQAFADTTEEKRELRKQGKALEEQKHKLTEAVVRLGEERAQFDKDRSQLTDEKRSKKAKRSIDDLEKPQAIPSPRKIRVKADKAHSYAQPNLAAEPVSSSNSVVTATFKASTTSAVLQNILAVGEDTPPARPFLATKAGNPQVATRSQKKRNEPSMTLKAPASAASAARDRVQRAVQAASAHISETRKPFEGKKQK